MNNHLLSVALVASALLVVGTGRAQDRAVVCFHADANWQGASQCFPVGSDSRNLDGTGFNDRFSSIRVYGNVTTQVFENWDYGGDQARFNRDVPDLAYVGRSHGQSWNDSISSLRVFSNH